MNAEQASKYEMRKLTCHNFRESCYYEEDERSVLAVPPGYWRQHAYKRLSVIANRTPARDRPDAIGWRSIFANN
jgi:hypothetical protein